MNDIISLKKLRINLTSYTNQVVKNGKSFIVFKKTKPVFKIVPVKTAERWEIVTDFTEISQHGIPAKKILKLLKTMRD